VYVTADGVEAMSHEKKLITFLLNNYQRMGVVGRPVKNQTSTIKVYFGLALIQLLDLDERNQILTSNVWLRYVRRVIGFRVGWVRKGGGGGGSRDRWPIVRVAEGTDNE
jgi:hypothetical protein